MNTIAFIILLAIIFDFILNGIADYLNLKMLRSVLPRPFQEVYDSDRYRKSQQYLKINTRFGWVTGIFNVIVMLLFWFGKGFPLLDEWVRSFNYGPVITGLSYMGILIFVKSLLSLPFSIYSTFVIEERFGFNQTTWSTFVLDLAKGVLLAVLIGTPLLAGILLFFEYAGANAWWYCWIAVTLYMLGVQFIAPTWIMPFFNPTPGR
jgi:STE24 endopeptidase